MGERLNDRSLASLLGPLWQWLDGMEIRRHQGPGDGGWLVVGVKGAGVERRVQRTGAPPRPLPAGASERMSISRPSSMPS